MKRFVLGLLLGVLSVLALGGCGKGKRDPGTIIIGIPKSDVIEDYNNNRFTEWLEAETGIDIQFVLYEKDREHYEAQLRHQIERGEKLPDLFLNFYLEERTISEFGHDGVFIDMKPYYDDREGLAKPFWDGITQFDETFERDVLRKLTDVDTGAMYCAARIEYALIDPMDYQVYINKQWLENLQMDQPTTLEELYDTLVAFRDNDPNGNGIHDEIPLVARISSDYGDAINWLTNFFIYCDDNKWFDADDDQNLYLPHMREEYREALAFIRDLQTEGLFDERFYELNQAELKALLTPKNGIETVGIFSEHSSLAWISNSPQMADYEALNLYGYAVKNSQAITRKNYITRDCQYPENAFKVLMTLYTDEGWKRMYYGEKGKDWDDADAGQVSYMGLPADIKDINHIWNQFDLPEVTWLAVPAFAFFSEAETAQFTQENTWLAKRYSEVRKCYEYYEAAAQRNNPKYIVQSLIYNSRERDLTQDIRTHVRDIIQDFRKQCFLGELDPMDDAVWQAYLEELEQAGVNVWLKQAQRLYDEQQRK